MPDQLAEAENRQEPFSAAGSACLHLIVLPPPAAQKRWPHPCAHSWQRLDKVPLHGDIVPSGKCGFGKGRGLLAGLPRRKGLSFPEARLLTGREVGAHAGHRHSARQQHGVRPQTRPPTVFWAFPRGARRAPLSGELRRGGSLGGQAVTPGRGGCLSFPSTKGAGAPLSRRRPSQCL